MCVCVCKNRKRNFVRKTNETTRSVSSSVVNNTAREMHSVELVKHLFAEKHNSRFHIKMHIDIFVYICISREVYNNKTEYMRKFQVRSYVQSDVRMKKKKKENQQHNVSKIERSCVCKANFSPKSRAIVELQMHFEYLEHIN